MSLQCKVEIHLTPEAHIISEDDTHAVVAVRIEKAWLTRNIHFLTALADCAAVLTVIPMG
jgi:hypothetical protein